MDKKMLSLEIPNDLREALRRRAFVEDLSISKLIRKILEEKLWDELSIIRREETDGFKG